MLPWQPLDLSWCFLMVKLGFGGRGQCSPLSQTLPPCRCSKEEKFDVSQRSRGETSKHAKGPNCDQLKNNIFYCHWRMHSPFLFHHFLQPKHWKESQRDSDPQESRLHTFHDTVSMTAKVSAVLQLSLGNHL